MSLFSYKTGVWPISLEIAGARMTLNQDGSVGLMLGATEIGQSTEPPPAASSEHIVITK